MKECSHVKADGNTCKSPRINGENFCYFHVAARDRIRRQRIAAQRKLPLQIPILEDHESIQLTITDVVNAMLADRIDYKKAALALYALQTAAVNVKHTTFDEPHNNWKSYNPHLDPALPQIEDETDPSEPESEEKKPSESIQEDQVIPRIEASAERSRRARSSSPSPKKPPQRAASNHNQALVQSALKHLRKRSTA